MYMLFLFTESDGPGLGLLNTTRKVSATFPVILPFQNHDNRKTTFYNFLKLVLVFCLCFKAQLHISPQLTVDVLELTENCDKFQSVSINREGNVGIYCCCLAL